MAKPLRSTPPTSSIALHLDTEAFQRALTPDAGRSKPSRINPQIPFADDRTGEPANINREFVLTPSAAETMDRLLSMLRRATKTRMSASHLQRILLSVVERAFDGIARAAEDLPPMKYPSNARGQEVERDRFEARIAEAVYAGIRESGFDARRDLLKNR
jgi:hypothetical protein